MNTNSTGATGAQLAHDRIDRYRSLGAFGRPVYQSHVQLRAMLKSKRGDKVANYFARPTYDPDLGELRWTAEVPGNARAWHEMSGEEQIERALDLEVVRSGLLSFAQELRAQNGGQPGGAASFASLLEQAIRVPADGNFLYFVGDQPVIAFWGFEDANGFSVDPSAQAPKSVPRPVPTVPQEAVVAPVPPAPVVVNGKRPWWMWLLLALLALLLLALLFFGLRGCKSGDEAVPPAGPSTEKPADPALPTPLGKAAVQPPVESVAPPVPGDSAPDGAVPPGTGTVPSIVPPVTQGTTPDGAQLAPDARPDDALPLDAKEPPRDLAPGSRTDPPVLDPPTPPDATDLKDADKAPPVPPPSPEAGRPMDMPNKPDAARPMNFLEGEWRAGEGLVDQNTKQPLDLSFSFGKEGKGEVTLRRPDGTVCRGPVQGRMDGGKLSIQGNQAVPCNNGRHYGAPNIECNKDSAGQTQCFGVNPDGSRYYMGMQRR